MEIHIHESAMLCLKTYALKEAVLSPGIVQWIPRALCQPF